MAAENLTTTPVILYVEDDDLNQLVVKAMLNSAGYENILIAADAEEAIKILEKPTISFDLILMDLGLPGMDGITLTEKIRQSEWKIKDVPIIALTGNAESAAKTQCFAAGMNDFLMKPINQDLLITTVKKFCNK